ncbi:MAG TPA: type II toxin-antitoxin system RelE/ParE family toxin [Gammaproteobacteria bacterium]|nr:type II toxin-antitoxin system RelE/ParE family toxin [Gammaproteobacteria bacterium]
MNYETIVYESSAGRAFFNEWFEKLAPTIAAKITSAIHKLEAGNLSNTKFLREGVWEFKINAGPGYRIYFGKVDKRVILLLAGGTKKAQQKDIDLAIGLLQEYKKAGMH